MLPTHPSPPDTPAASLAPARTFYPDPATTARLIEDLSCPDLTIREVAQRYRTDLTQLTLFLMSHQGAAHVAQFEQAAAARARLTASSHLPRLVNALVTMLDAYVFEADKLIQDTPRTRIFREHQRVNARRAAHLLFRVSSYHPRAAHTPTSPPPTGSPQTSRPQTSSPTVREGLPPSTNSPPSPHPRANPPAQAEDQSPSGRNPHRPALPVPCPSDTQIPHVALAPPPFPAPSASPAPLAAHHASGNPEACHPGPAPHAILSG